MSGCRIARYKLKKGGANVELLQTKQRTHFDESVENLSQRLDSNTHAMGYFILNKSGELTSGISYESGFYPSQLFGACEYMKEQLWEKVWGNDDE